MGLAQAVEGAVSRFPGRGSFGQVRLVSIKRGTLSDEGRLPGAMRRNGGDLLPVKQQARSRNYFLLSQLEIPGFDLKAGQRVGSAEDVRAGRNIGEGLPSGARGREPSGRTD